MVIARVRMLVTTLFFVCVFVLVVILYYVYAEQQARIAVNREASRRTLMARSVAGMSLSQVIIKLGQPDHMIVPTNQADRDRIELIYRYPIPTLPLVYAAPGELRIVLEGRHTVMATVADFDIR